MVSFTLNGKAVSVDVPDSTPLLWVIREHMKLTGTKFGCGAGLCGACTVHLDGEAQRSCSVPMEAVAGRKVTTLEGLPAGHPVPAAWIEEDVPQCGYCQPGMIMATAAFLAQTPKPTDAQIDEAITNICRCGTYSRIRRAIHRAAGQPSPERRG
jgi:aerobic-type carbon monoxide dehydrogenase small subunit (CoxS/CutS family)